MKTFKLALLGGAALAVTAAGAQADELSDLKAQLEALNSRVGQIETQPAPAVPEGASLVMFKSGQAFIDSTPRRPSDRKDPNQGFSIAITPTADLPAPVAEVTVSGRIRGLLTYNDTDGRSFHEIVPGEDGDRIFRFEEDIDDYIDVQHRVRLEVDGKTETAVGEVGGHIRLQGGEVVEEPDVDAHEFWGYWQMSDAWRLQVGKWDSTASVQSGYDWDAYLSGYAQESYSFNSIGVSDARTEQFQLRYTGGPLVWAVAVEDAPDRYPAESDVPDIASYLQYNGDIVMLMVTGVVSNYDNGDDFGFDLDDDGVDDHFESDDTDWFIGGGARFGLAEVATLSFAGGFGEGYSRATIITLDPGDVEYWGVSGLLTFTMSEVTRLEIGGGWSEADNFVGGSVEDKWLVGGGIYWNPVSQLTIGLQADYTQNSIVGHRTHPDDQVTGVSYFDDEDVDEFNVALGTWFSF